MRGAIGQSRGLQILVFVLQFRSMGNTLSIRLTDELAAWVEATAKRTGVSQSQIIRTQLERARSEKSERKFMRPAGCVEGPRDLSTRRGFAKR